MVLAYSTGQELNVIPDDIAEKTAAAWDDYRGMGAAHFEQLKAKLDRTDPTYRQ